MISHYLPQRILAAAFVVLSFCASAEAELLITVSEDAWIDTESDVNNGADNKIASETFAAVGYVGSWMKFDLSSLSGMLPITAELELRTELIHSTAISHEVFSSSDDTWAELAITGMNQPSEATLTSLESISIPDINNTYSWDVLSAVNGLDGTDNSTLTLFIRPEVFPVDLLQGLHFNSRESSDFHPVLRVTFVPEPSTLGLVVSSILVFVSRFRHSNAPRVG